MIIKLSLVFLSLSLVSCVTTAGSSGDPLTRLGESLGLNMEGVSTYFIKKTNPNQSQDLYLRVNGSDFFLRTVDNFQPLSGEERRKSWGVPGSALKACTYVTSSAAEGVRSEDARRGVMYVRVKSKMIYVYESLSTGTERYAGGFRLFKKIAW